MGELLEAGLIAVCDAVQASCVALNPLQCYVCDAAVIVDHMYTETEQVHTMPVTVYYNKKNRSGGCAA